MCKWLWFSGRINLFECTTVYDINTPQSKQQPKEILTEKKKRLSKQTLNTSLAPIRGSTTGRELVFEPLEQTIRLPITCLHIFC